MLSLLLAFTCLTQQPQTIYEKLVTKPNPQNGYEDYLRACDVVNDGFADLFQRQDDADVRDPARAKLQQELKGLTYLEVCGKMAARYAPALDLIRSGNEKSAWYPAEDFGVGARNPQFHSFYSLARLFEAEAYSRFAKGNTAAGTKALLDGMTFARKIRLGKGIDFAIGTDIAEQLTSDFAPRIDQLSQADLARVEKFVARAAAEPNAYVPVLKSELSLQIKRVPDMVAVHPFTPSDDARLDSVENWINGLSAEDRRALATQTEDEVRRSYEAVIRRMSGPEDSWLTPDAHRERDTSVVHSSAEVAGFLSQILAPVDYSREMMMHRTQLRILLLTARVADYRWLNLQLPESLDKAAPATELYDPLSKKPFLYELKDFGTYTITSAGADGTGPVKLIHAYSSPNSRREISPESSAKMGG